MNKLLFTLKRQYNDTITLVANNHKDLEHYLNENHDWYMIEVQDEGVIIQDFLGSEHEIATLEWIKQI